MTGKKIVTRKQIAHKGSTPKRIKPMLARDNPFAAEMFKRKDYVLQEKYDGTRIVAINQGNGWHLMTRHWKNDVASKFPEIVKELSKIKSNDVILDGELTFFKNGKGVFLTVLANPETKAGYKAQLMLFDVIRYNGDKTKWPLTERIKLLNKIDPSGTYVSVVKTIETPSSYKKVYDTIVKNNGEGVIMKKKDSPYVYDSRQHWIKVKGTYTEDAIVIGMTHGTGKRMATFGALIIAQYDKNGKLVIIGKASGFDDATGLKLYKAFMSMPNHSYPGLQMTNVKKWVPPRVVIEVRYMEKTPYGILRHPVFMRIRDDKSPSEARIQYKR